MEGSRTLVALFGGCGTSALDGLGDLVGGIPRVTVSEVVGRKKGGGKMPYLMVSIMDVFWCNELIIWMWCLSV